jgi:hypothetical protein
MIDWISTDSMLPAFGKRVLLCYDVFQHDGKGGQNKSQLYTVGKLVREEGWVTDEGRIEEDGLFDAQFQPQWWMRIEQPPPF